MNRTNKTNNSVYPKPVRKVELSEKNVFARIVAIVCLILITIIAFTHAMSTLLKTPTGWTTITVNSSAKLNCGDEFVFLYDLGKSKEAVSVEKKKVTALYSDAMVKAYEVFNEEDDFSNEKNIAYVNQHPNEKIQVDAELYKAFELLEKYKNRSIYLAPVYSEYAGLFACTNDAQIKDYDVTQNDDLKTEFAKITAFANNPNSVQIELLGNNEVKLLVSNDYMAYAKENDITNFINFYWMKNAFIVDYLADTLKENHYTRGSISSYNGFVRNLDEDNQSYSYNVYDREGNTVYEAGVMNYQGRKSIVNLKNFKLSELDDQFYYDMSNGEVKTAYIDSLDGYAKTSTNELISYSNQQSCSEILLQMLPIYISDTFQQDKVESLLDHQIYTLYCKDNTIYYNDSKLSITNLYKKDGVEFKLNYLRK